MPQCDETSTLQCFDRLVALADDSSRLFHGQVGDDAQHDHLALVVRQTSKQLVYARCTEACLDVILNVAGSCVSEPVA